MAETMVVGAQVAEWFVECRSTSAVIASSFRRVFGPAPTPPAGAIPDIVINAEITPPSEMSSSDGWKIIDEDETGALWSTPTGGAATLGGSVALFDGPTATFAFADEKVVSQTIHTLVTHTLSHCAHLADLVPSHSALVGVDGTWFLAVGASGVGKSTTCLAASRGGHLVGGDDTCLLRLHDGELWAHGIPRAPSVPLVQHGLGDGRPVDHRDRTNDPAFVLTPGWHRLDAVLLLEHGVADATDLGQVKKMRLIEALTASMAGALAAPVVVDALPGVLRAASRLPSRTLALGADPMRRLESTSTALIKTANMFGVKP